MKQRLLYGGLSREEYEECRGQILQKNAGTLISGSAVTTVMFAGLLAGCAFSEAMRRSIGYYLVMAIVCGTVLLLSLTAVKKKQQLSLPLWYVLFVAFGWYGICMNTFVRPELSSTTLCVFIVAGPLLILDRPCRVMGFSAALSVAYIICARLTKSPYLAFADSVNVACCLLISMVIYASLTGVRMREILQAKRLKEAGDTDRLTGLLNKTAAEEQIRASLETVSDPETYTGMDVLLVADLDGFKQINDTYGHAFGDVVLRWTADCIRKAFRENDILSRFGGDEFVLYLPNMEKQDLKERLETLMRMIEEEIPLPAPQQHMTISVGAACFPQDSTEYSSLFHCADKALYSAKKAGKNQYCICSEME